MTLLDFVAYRLMPRLLHRRGFVLVYCEEVEGHYILTIKKRTKSGIKTIIINHDGLIRLYKKEVSEKPTSLTHEMDRPITGGLRSPKSSPRRKPGSRKSFDFSLRSK